MELRPNLTYGMPIVAAMRKLTTLPLDVHLMIAHPERYAQQFIEAGADAITFHWEASKEPDSLLDQIQSSGVLAGLAINPSTPWPENLQVFSKCDLVLVMSVEAGFGGQAFDAIALQRLRQLRAHSAIACFWKSTVESIPTPSEVVRKQAPIC